MKKILIILILILTGCSNQITDRGVKKSSSTDLEKYDALVWSGMLHFKDKQYQDALSNFQDAFKIKSDENVSDYFYAAAAALNLNKDNLAKDLIISAIEKTNAAESYFDNFNEFDPFRAKELFSEIKADYAKHQAKFFNNLANLAIYEELELLIERDQKVRTDGSSLEEMRKVDSLNISRLIEINKAYGWQEKQWLLLWHHRGIHRDDNYIWNYFRPFINKKIERGELRKSFWAQFDDEKSMFSEDGTQIYGTFWNNYAQFPIKNIEKVDSLRSTVGLPPLSYMKKVYDAPLPVGYTGKLPPNMYK